MKTIALSENNHEWLKALCKHYNYSMDELIKMWRDKVAQRKQVLFYDDLTKVKVDYHKPLKNKKILKNYKIK
jgi:hypothetical protein